MKKNISVLLSLLAATSVFTSACGGHEHTFSDAWENNATHHWHAATCEHGEEKNSYGTHTDTNEDGICDTCTYAVGHTHTFANDWTQGETHHWKAATCSHTEEKSEYALHEDANTDAECDICGAHVHIVNNAGGCDDCGEQVVPVDETNMGMVIAAVGVNKGKIVSSTTMYSFDSTIKTLPEGETEEGYNRTQASIMYTYGVDASFVEKTTSSEARTPNQAFTAMVEATSSVSTKTWIYTDAQDTENPVKAIQELTKDDESEVSTIASSADDLSGYYYAVSTLADGYGAEAILAALYEMSQDTTASNYSAQHDAETNTYSFSFSNLIINESQTNEGLVINVNLFESTVAFMYDDNFTLTAFAVQTNCYTNDAGEHSEKDITLEFNEDTETWQKTADATPSVYTYQTMQEVGERVYTHTKSIDEYKPTGFTFSANDSALTSGETMEFTAGDDMEIDMACVPATAHFNLVRDLIDVTLVNTADNSNYPISLQYRDSGTPYLAAFALSAGEYTLTVTYNDDSIFTATVSVAEPQVEGDYITVTLTDNYSWIDLATFTAEESGTYTFNIPAGYGAWDQEECDFNPWGSRPYVDFQTDNGGSFSVDIAAGNSYSFYVGALTKGEVKIPYSFVAKEIEGGNEGGGDSGDVMPMKDANGLGGEYTFNFVMDFTLTFTPDYEGAPSGTLTVVDPVTSANGGDFTYTIVNGQYLFNDANISVALDGDAWMFKNKTMSVAKPFAQYVAPPVDANGLGGEYTFTFVMKFSLTFTPDSDGAASGTLTVVDPITSSNSGDYAYTIVNGAYVFEDSKISITNDGTSWYFQATGMNPAPFTPYVAPPAPPVDANGLGGEYTFTFVMKFSLTFTPDSDGAASGTLTVVDPINSLNSGDYAYTIVNGAYVFEDSKISITNDGTSWYFQATGMNPAPFAQYVAPPAPPVDANGLGGEYTFTFVMKFSLTFTPDSDGAASGTLTVVDPITSSNSGDYAYTIVDGQYVFEDSKISITNDGTSWYFQATGMNPAPFAQYVAPPAPPVDANGLGGEYTFTFVMKFSLTFTPDSDGAASGTLTVVDPITSSNSGDYAYTIVDGQYVFEDSKISITNDGTSWYFQATGMNPAPFAQYEA